MKKIVLLLTLTFPVLLFAQRTANLTIFSEDGDRFTLVLNGEKQNDKPQTNIRVEELPQPYYSAKIIFADSSLPAITKNLQVTDVDNKMMDVTYRLKKDKAGKVKLGMYSSIEVQPDFVAPSNVYVHHYGQSGGTGGIRETTTTTSTSNTMNASVSVPGVSMNVTINDPDVTTTTTTTTTTSHSSHSSHSSSSNHNSNEDHDNDNDACYRAMNSSDFMAAKKSIQDASFENTKLSTAKSIAAANCLSADQVASLCGLFNFEDSKLEFAKYAYKRTVDKKNYFKVSSVFSFDSSKEELSKFTSGE